MTLMVHASKGAESIGTPRSSPVLAVAYARALVKDGWSVHIVNEKDERFTPPDFDQLLAFDPPPLPEVTVQKPAPQTSLREQKSGNEGVFDTLNEVLAEHRAKK